VIGVDDELSTPVLRAIYKPLTSGSYYGQETVIPFSGYAPKQAPLIVTTARRGRVLRVRKSPLTRSLPTG
jgi:hypothetical protein